MGFCPNCGEKIESGVEFCPNCGLKKGEVKTTTHETLSETKNKTKRILLLLLILIWPVGIIYYFIKKQDIKNANEKNWIFNHPFIVWIIWTFSIWAIIWISVFSPNNAIPQTSLNNGLSNTGAIPTSTSLPQREYINESLDDLIFTFVSQDSELTGLQKKDEFKKYEGKYIKGEGFVKDVNEVLGSLVVGIEHPDNQFLRGASVYFKKSERDKLLNIGVGDPISFEGLVEDYSSFGGVIIKSAEVR